MDGDRAFVGSIPELYDNYLGPMLFEPFARELAARLAGFDGALLETAAGTGRVTRALAAVVGPNATIVATDLAEPMLERGEALVDAARLTWRQADAQSLPFDDASFDAVVCQFGMMFLPDKAAGYAEARRVLRSGGRFLFNVWDHIGANELSAAVADAVARRFPDDPPNFLARTPYGYHDPAAIRASLLAAGFRDPAVEVVTLVTPAASAWTAAAGLCMGSPLRGEIEERAPGQVEAVTQEVAAALERRFGAGPIAGKGQALMVTALR